MDSTTEVLESYLEEMWIRIWMYGETCKSEGNAGRMPASPEESETYRKDSELEFENLRQMFIGITGFEPIWNEYDPVWMQQEDDLTMMVFQNNSHWSFKKVEE